MILHHPKDIVTELGLRVIFSIETSRTATEHQWYFQQQLISSEDVTYNGFTTDTLTITKCLPKHKGVYKCVVTDESGEMFMSESATLKISKFILAIVLYCNLIIYTNL